MSVVITGGILLFVLALGFVAAVKRVRSLSERIDFTTEYLSNFRDFAANWNPSAFDTEAYSWLNRRSARMQEELAESGSVSYRPPFAGYIHQNYPILINTLSQIRLGRLEHPGAITQCETIMERHLGSLEDIRARARTDLSNPLRWLNVGVSLLVTFPIRVAYMSGLLEHSTYEQAATSRIARMISFIVAMIGLFGTIIGILVDWKDFTDILRRLMK